MRTGVLGFSVFLLLVILPFKGTAYERDLQELSDTLIVKLDSTAQRSGTVLDFTDLQGVPTELGRFLAQELSDRLVTNGRRMAFIDRINIRHLLNENKLSEDGFINPKTSQKLGNMVGIDTVIVGTTTPLGETIRISVRAISVDTGKIVATQAASLKTTLELRELMNRGVSGGVGGPVSARSATPLDNKGMMRPDAFRIMIKEVVHDDRGYQRDAYISFTINNSYGKNVQIGLIQYSMSAGGCAASVGESAAGIPLISNDYSFRDVQDMNLPVLVAGGSLSATYGNICRNPSLVGQTQTDVSSTLVILVDKELVKLPISVAGVPVRQVR